VAHDAVGHLALDQYLFAFVKQFPAGGIALVGLFDGEDSLGRREPRAKQGDRQQPPWQAPQRRGP
jgi:hypothetical protein